MATFHINWHTDNTTGTVNYKLRYRLSGDPTWTSQLLAASGTTATLVVSNNRIYDVQVQNINNNDNPFSVISQAIGFSDPNPVFSPTNTSVGYSFSNLSVDIDSYTTTIALFSSPGVIIATHILSPTNIVTDTFTGLTPLTQYSVTIKPAANQFFDTFTYTFTTEELATCADPINTIATLS